jgi:hypothetical protein
MYQASSSLNPEALIIPEEGTTDQSDQDDTDKNVEGSNFPSLEGGQVSELQGESKTQLKRYSLAFSLTTFGVRLFVSYI